MERVLVQVRRTKNKVEVGVVRELAGVCVRFESRRARIVTNADVTSGAEDWATALRLHDIEIELTHGRELVELLGVFNSELPPLDSPLLPKIIDLRARRRE